MNILLTLDCNLDCAYCFARSCKAASLRQEMTLDELDTLLCRMDPNVDEVRLMGGEPTLHTCYPEVMHLVKSSGFRVTVFTNGTQASLRQTAPDLPDSVLLNLNDWQFYSVEQRAVILDNIAALRGRVGLGYTITRPEFNLADHVRLVREYGLKPVIRLGLAQPVFGGDNDYLPDEALLAAHQAVVNWATRLAAEGIRLSFDCGFMRCHFSESNIESLVRANTAMRFICPPSLDVGPGLQTWRCFAFSAGSGVDWRTFQNADQARARFAGQDKIINSDCDECGDHRSGWCQGGCLARRAIRASDLALTPASLRKFIGLMTK